MIVLASTLHVDWLKALLVCLGLLYTWIAWRFWFHIPLTGCALATGLMVAGWAVR